MAIAATIAPLLLTVAPARVASVAVLLRPVMRRRIVARRRAPFGLRKLDLNQLLDVAQEGGLFVVAERDRDARRAGPRRAADAVHVALRNVRQVVVDDVADAVDVDAARRDVGCDQRLELAGAERAK